MALTKVSGSILKNPLSLSGNVSVGGTLTYEDVTNVDSVGVITARSGINLTGGDLKIGGNTVINSGRALYNVEQVKLADSKELILGSGNDLKIYHSGSHSFIDEVGNGALKIKGDDIRFENASGTEAARIDSSGRVLVGTTTVGRAGADELTIGNGSGDIGLSIRSGSSQEGNIYFSDSTSSGNGESRGIIRFDHSTDSLQFFTASGNNFSQERFRITSDGKFGFGTSSPDQTVHIHKGSAGSINSTANTVLTLENSTTNILQFLNPNNTAAQVRFGDPQDDGAGFIEYNHAANTMAFGANGPTRMILDGNGHMGIAVASTTQLANSKQLTLRPTDDDGLRLIRPGDGNNSPNIHLDLTTTTSGSSLRNGGEAYTTKYHTYNCDMLFRSYLGGGTGGIIRLMTADGSSGTTRYWQIDEKGKTEHRSRSTSVKTHEFTYTDGAAGGVQTVTLCTLSNYSGSSTAVAQITYVGSYGLANDYVASGGWICGIRRANSNSAWAFRNTEYGNNGSSVATLDLAWNNSGQLQAITAGAWMGWTVHVTVTTYNFDLTVNV